MRRLILAAALVLAACASAEPASVPTSARSQPNYQDARSTASAADVQAARRGYRDACHANGGSADRCECLTSNLAQTLSPEDMRVATGMLDQRTAANWANLAAVNQARTQAEAACAQFR